MKNVFLAASLFGAFAWPAFAADGPYVGVEGGVTVPHTTDLDVILNNTTAGTTSTYANGVSVKSKTGWDVDAIAGYKFGLFKLELEGGYQRAPVKRTTVDSTLLTDVGTASGSTASASDLGLGTRIGVKKLMANALLDTDFGNSRFGGYVGGGAGRAWASYSGAKDNAWALQGIAGVRYSLTDNVDAGLKYEYFHAGKLQFDDAFALNGTNFTTSAKGNYDSHSLLASLVYNFNGRQSPAPVETAAPVAPPPPPPAAPATQTCADGSVVLATASCPVPPPPPPPPPAASSGERG